MQGIGEFYLEHGYQPKNAGMTIESNFQDWALAQMAVRLGLEDKAAYFGNRSHGWRKLYRPDQQLLFPKDEQGQWLHDDPLRGTGWIEANAWQATWGVSHELPTLATLMGGYDKFCEKLNYAFERPRRRISCSATDKATSATPTSPDAPTRTYSAGAGNPGSRNTGFAG